MPNPNISELISTTLNSRTGEFADNVLKNNALLVRLKEKGKVKLARGGTSIYQELSYAENGTFQYYDGYDPLNVGASDVLTSAEFAWKQAAVAVTISGKEERINSGKEAIIDLLESRIDNAQSTLMNNISSGIYSDGTGSGGKQIGGLQLLVADTPTSGTVGGINRATASNAFWRNITYDATTDGGAAAAAANIQRYMNTVYIQLVRGTDRPDLIVADNNYWRLYLESLQAIQRITSDKMAQAGFMSLKYMDADVVLDGGFGAVAPANHMYFLNTKYIFYRPHAECNMVPLSPDRFATNQDAHVKLVGWMGNMTMSNASLQGVLKD
jgi:hypothetical protein